MVHNFQAYPLLKSDVAFSSIQKWLDIDIKQPRKLYDTQKIFIQ